MYASYSEYFASHMILNSKTPVQQDTNRLPESIGGGEFGEFNSYSVYGAWRFGRVQDATVGYGVAEPSKTLQPWDSYGAYLISDFTN